MENDNNMDTNTYINNEKQEQEATLSTIIATVESQRQDRDDDDLRKFHRHFLFKIDIPIVVLFSLCYLVSFMDRSNIGNAKVAGLTDTTEITENGYNAALSLFFVGYIFSDIPSNIVLNKVGARLWISCIMILCGSVMMGMVGVKNDSHLMVTRFFLGVTEGGLLPGILFVMSVWYTKVQITKRIAIVTSQSAIANAVGGLLGFASMSLEGVGGLHSWQWLFLIEGILTVTVGIFVYIFLPDFPERVLREQEQVLFTEKMCQISTTSQYIFEGYVHERFSSRHIFLVLKDYHIYLYSIMSICSMTVLYSNGMFLPSIVHGFGYTALKSQLMTVPPNAIASVCSIIFAFSADYNKERGYHIFSGQLVSALGFALLIVLKDHGTTALYISVILAVVGMQIFSACCTSWFSCNFAGRIKRNIAIALIMSFANFGGIISGQIYRQADAPQYIHGHTAALVLASCGAILTITMKFLFKRENTRRNKLTIEERQSILAKDAPDKLGDKHPNFRYLA
ncbi:major facilitator superfamily domain-containing protein [Phascolomyces articulosus]|uniref:Major facilitator superfamily domain-containing protein n=1 Tax=Phascolomyces articulosus TaxID=60185 RepID=A0AAD5K8X2_9FUNG|nr:major facilitator superfamily domain-containing protein [Phascolomyces articulosus]